MSRFLGQNSRVLVRAIVILVGAIVRVISTNGVIRVIKGSKGIRVFWVMKMIHL